METWVKMYGVYEVSSFGRVRSIKSGKILNTYLGRGMSYIKLDLGNGRKGYLIHRLVANAFLQRTEGKDQVNHIDGNPLNNLVHNLEWCTPKENIYHSRNISRHGAVISVKKINDLYSKNQGATLQEFVSCLVEEAR